MEGESTNKEELNMNNNQDLLNWMNKMAVIESVSKFAYCRQPGVGSAAAAIYGRSESRLYVLGGRRAYNHTG